MDSSGAEANGDSSDSGHGPSSSALSADGRFVAFASVASNLVAGDTNNTRDVFVHDRQTGTTERVSVDSSGAQAGNASDFSISPALSADGRFVAFRSYASDLVAGDTNNTGDVFVHDRQTGTTERVSVDSSGAQANSYCGDPALSADGRFVAFHSDASNLVAGVTNNKVAIFVHDRQSGTTERASVDSSGAQANGHSSYPVLSADGRFVAFHSDASNLVAGDTNNTRDVFVRDRQTGTTERASVDSGGTQASGSSSDPAISADGRFVAFHSSASNLVAGDTNNNWDVFVHDRQTGATERVSVDSSGAEQRPSGNTPNPNPALSADGRFVAFMTDASNLVADDTNNRLDIVVHDRQTGTTERASVDSGGAQANGYSSYPVLSADGRFVAFDSDASNLVAGDTNSKVDVFVHALP